MNMMLSPKQIQRCLDTVSPNTFFMLVQHALASRAPLSVVRMGDGERLLLEQFDKPGPVEPPPGYDTAWLERLGCDGIERTELRRRMLIATSRCTYFAPSITGIQQKGFNLHDQFVERFRYVDNFFVNEWSDEKKISLYKQAGHILFIHGNPHTADSLQLRVQANLQVKVSYLRLNSWRQSEDVMLAAQRSTAPLVLFSGGPASKYIAPEIAGGRGGGRGRVVLDIGNAADLWTLPNLPLNREAAESFHAEWSRRAA